MKKTFIISIILIALGTLLTSCSDNFTCSFNGNIEFKYTSNTPAIPYEQLQDPKIILYNESGEILATTSDFADGHYNITLDVTEGNYKIKASASYKKNDRTFVLFATSGMFHIADGTSNYTHNLYGIRQ